ncbi:MAG TPA: hypothetical protein VGL91_14660 [Acidobacteriota bacterium]|jgi:hypothetical protein
MRKIGRAIVSVLLWSYERGSWQYDVMCLLIIAFILFTPRSWFQADFKHEQPPAAARQGSLYQASGSGVQREKVEKLVQVNEEKR